MSSLKYLGWLRFTNTGSAYRKWQFEKDVPELEAKKGWVLLDYGPQGEGSRFQVRSAKDKWWWDAEDVYEWNSLLKDLRWNPPREGEEKIAKAIDYVATQLESLVATMKLKGKAERTLDDIQSTLDRSTTSNREPEPTSTENRYLRLKFDGQYDNGDPYQDYELLLDAPMVPATRTRLVEGPRHAIKGDLIRVIDDGDRFSLRRGNKRIGSPEWWQLKELFVGISVRGETKEEEDTADEMPPHHKRALALLGEGRCMCAHVLERDVPEIRLEVGDLIVHTWSPPFPEMGGRVRYLTMDDYARLRAATVDSFDETFTLLAKLYDFGADDLYKFLGSPGKWGKKLKVWHSRLAVVRSSRSPVGEPIAASSDDAALFELIYSTGGKMPGEATQ